MGDRSNVKLVYTDEAEEQEQLYVYSHWAGMEMPGVAKQVMDGPAFRARLGDSPYLGRIFISQYIELHQATLEEAGFGVSPWEIDNEHPILEIALHLNEGGWRWEGAKIWEALDTFEGKYPDE